MLWIAAVPYADEVIVVITKSQNGTPSILHQSGHGCWFSAVLLCSGGDEKEKEEQFGNIRVQAPCSGTEEGEHHLTWLPRVDFPFSASRFQDGTVKTEKNPRFVLHYVIQGFFILSYLMLIAFLLAINSVLRCLLTIPIIGRKNGRWVGLGRSDYDGLLNSILGNLQ